ncbi:MAG: transcriptional regulator [Proteobacteria bacterium SG_bin9]|nr:MAG: transcriptional regulator [Proteobacteria bacterium SG_bin9]
MVYYQATADSQLNQTFAALADPTRRALLMRLEGQETVSVSDLAKPFAMSLPAVMKHLDVLAGAGLVTRSKNGRTVTCRLNAAPMKDANEWLERYARFWTQRLDRLEQFLETQTCTPEQQQNQVSPSPGDSTPRPRKSTRRGPNPSGSSAGSGRKTSTP